MGSRFEWPDISKHITVTGQIEADFEGNFCEVDNRNVSSIRRNALQLRLAYGRIDWTLKPETDVFFEAGQDWTIFGSSALDEPVRNDFFGAYWGNVYERTPQFRLGLVPEIGGSRNWKLSPEFALMMPSQASCRQAPWSVPKHITSGTGCTYVNGLQIRLDTASARL